METSISSSVSSFKAPIIHPRIWETHRFNPSSHISAFTSSAAAAAATAASAKPPNHVSKKPTPSSLSHKHSNAVLPSSTKLITSLPPKQTPAVVHRDAASGYAAALVDAALCSNSLEAIHRDVIRFSRWLHHDENLKATNVYPDVEEREKGNLLKRVVEKGGFKRHLVALVKMLVAKGKSGIVMEVMEEFERIYDEVSGTLRVTLVSGTENKMEEEQVLGMAKRMQKLSGAMRVKVRHFVDQSVPSFVV